MLIGTRLLTYIITAEFSLVFLVVLLTCVIRVSLFISNKGYANLKNKLENCLERSIKENRNIKFKKRWKNLKLLLPIIEKYDQERKTEWILYKENYIKKLLLSLTRKNARSKNWIKRLHSIRGFDQYFELSDEKLICRLLSDRVPIVRLEAIKLVTRLTLQAH